MDDRAISGLVLAVDVGGTSIKAEVTDSAGAVLAAGSRPAPAGAAAFDTACALGDDLLAQLPDRSQVLRSAVIMPGIVDSANGIAVFSGNLGWRDVKVGALFTDHWQLPVLIDHDGTVAGWAEWRIGAAAGVNDACVVIIGTGISGVLIAEGTLVRGALGKAGEYGHIPVRPNGLPCPCGNIGCLETVSSAQAIARAYGVPGAIDVVSALDTDARARAVWDDAVTALADAMVGVLVASCPEVLVVAGGLAEAGEAITAPLARALRERLSLNPPPRVVASTFGIRAGLVGAGLLARKGGREGQW